MAALDPGDTAGGFKGSRSGYALERLRVSPAREPTRVEFVSVRAARSRNDRAQDSESADMKLDRTMILAMGLAAAGLL